MAPRPKKVKESGALSASTNPVCFGVTTPQGCAYSPIFFTTEQVNVLIFSEHGIDSPRGLARRLQRFAAIDRFLYE